jgi:MraZ protein
MREWEAFEAKLGEQSQFEARLDFVRRHYLGNAIECEVDKLGRLILPSALRAHGKLEDTALWIGVGKRIELWQPALFAANNAVDLDTAESVADAKARLAELGL